MYRSDIMHIISNQSNPLNMDALYRAWDAKNVGTRAEIGRIVNTPRLLNVTHKEWSSFKCLLGL